MTVHRKPFAVAASVNNECIWFRHGMVKNRENCETVALNVLLYTIL